MKKLTLLLAAIATLFSSTLFTSCSEPESNDKPTIVGTWEYSQKSDGDEMVITLTFSKNGSASLIEVYKEGGMSEQYRYDFEYIYNEATNALTTIGDVDDFFGDRTEAYVTANKLRIVMYNDYYGESQSITFNRK